MTRVRSGAGGRAAAPFVWIVWAAMLAIALACIARYGRNVPLAEDWLLVAPLTGNEPDLAGWLWAQNNEHRVPLPRLALLGLLELAGGDFRAGMVFNALVLGALSAAMILTAGRLRGGISRYSDAFFPIVLLHLGHWGNVVWSWQVQFVLSTVLTCVLLLVVVGWREPPRPRAALVAGACLVLLPLCGANGLIVAVVMAPWFAFQGGRVLGGGHLDPQRVHAPGGAGPRRGMGLVLLASGGMALVLAAAYFVGYERATWNPPSPSPAATLETAVKFLALGFGPAAAAAWMPLALATAGVLLTGGTTLTAALIRSREDRLRAAGLLAFLAALGLLALAVGWGRAGLVPSVGLPARYALLALPALCTAYFAWELYGPPRLRAAAPPALLALVLVLVPANTRAGFGWRDWYAQGMAAVEQDIAEGVPRLDLARRHREFLLHWDEAKLASRMRMLREAGLGPFRRMREDPLVPQPTVPAGVSAEASAR